MKLFTKFASFALALSLLSAPFIGAEELNNDERQVRYDNTINDTIDQATSQENIQRTKTKLFRKIKHSLSKKNEAKLVRNISKSKDLTDVQQTELLQRLESIKPEIYALPDDSVQQ